MQKVFGILIFSFLMMITTTAYGTSPEATVYKGYEKEAEFELYHTDFIKVHVKPKESSGVIDVYMPQIWKASVRYGNWFQVKTSQGIGWVYYEDCVQLREIEHVNATLAIEGTAHIHKEPFKYYKTKKKVHSGAYTITKKAGDWYYLDGIGWIYKIKAIFPSVIKKLHTDALYAHGRRIPIKQSIVEKSEKVRPGTPLLPRYITIHNTSTVSQGADAYHFSKYLKRITKSQTRWASWHYSVDDHEIYQHLPLNEHGWHAGDQSGPGNYSSIGIEIAENQDGNYQLAQENAACLVANLLHAFHVPYNQIEDWVVPHQKWSGKPCPARIFNQPDGFRGFVEQVKEMY